MNGRPAVSPARRAPPQLVPGRLRRLTAGRKRATRPRGMPTGSPVRGFRATPVLRGDPYNTPNRRSTTRSPRSRAEPSYSNSAPTARRPMGGSRFPASITRLMRSAFTMPIRVHVPDLRMGDHDPDKPLTSRPGAFPQRLELHLKVFPQRLELHLKLFTVNGLSFFANLLVLFRLLEFAALPVQ